MKLNLKNELLFLLILFFGSVSMSAEFMTTIPRNLKYKPIALEDPTIPRNLIRHFNTIIDKEGFFEMDNKNIGNIPFYWVDQIYYNFDLTQSVTLKIRAELQDSEFEGKILELNENFVYHSRTKNGTAYALYFTGMGRNQIESIVDEATEKTKNFVAIKELDHSYLNQIAAIVIPNAQAAGKTMCNAGTTGMKYPVANPALLLKDAALNMLMKHAMPCVMNFLRSAWSGFKGEITGTIDQIKTVGTYAYDAAKTVGKAYVDVNKSAYNFVSGWAKDAWDNGIVDATGRAADKFTNKVSSVKKQVVQTVDNAVKNVSQFPEKIKMFITQIWSQIKAAAKNLINHPEALLQMFCKFIGGLAGGAAFNAVKTFLTGGAGVGVLMAGIGFKIAGLSGKLGKLGSLIELITKMGKGVAQNNLLMKIANGVESISDKTANVLQKMTKYKLTGPAMETVMCVM